MLHSRSLGLVSLLFAIATVWLILDRQPAKAVSARPESLVATAYEYGVPIFEEARLAYLFSYDPANPKRVPVNSFGHHRRLDDATDRTTTTPNNDTLYSSAILDLSAGPVTLKVPDFGRRYFSIAFLDSYTNNFAYLGTRANGGAGGAYLLVGPDWRKPLPAGARIIRAPGNHVIALVRILVDGPQDYAAVHQLQDRLTLTPPAPPPMRSGLIPPLAGNPENFVAVVNQVLHDDPPPARDANLLKDLAGVGIGPDVPPLTPEQIDLWSHHFAAARMNLIATSRNIGARIDGWDYPPPDIGDFGADYRTRAEIAVRGIGANITAEMIYAVASVDRSGADLDGSRHYRLHLPAGAPPARGFWSIAIYETTKDGHLFFGENPIHRFSIGDRTRGLIHNRDGSLDILIQREQPEGDRAANWLPVPAMEFVIIARAYLPGPTLLDGRFRYPGIEPLD